MRITCPHCGATGNIRDGLVPEAGKTISCPRCQGRFPVKREGAHAPPESPAPSTPGARRIPVSCPSCGASGTIAASLVPPGGKVITCPKCGGKIPVEQKARPGAAAPGGEVPYRCPKCDREGTVPSALIPEGGKAINCAACNTRFFIRGPHDTAEEAPTPEPRTAASRPIEPDLRPSAQAGIVSASVGGPGALYPSPSRPTPGRPPIRGPGSLSPGGSLALDDYWGTPSLGRAVAGGAAAAFIGSIVWAFITVMTSYQIGWMAVGVGALVGFAVKFFGRGQDKAFGIVGGGLALFGCMVGNLMASCAFISADPRNAGLGFLSILGDALFSPTTAFRVMAGTFHPIDILFYVLAVSAGYSVALKNE
jgi:predicted Zn finger-like uncharacterized protein